VLGIGAVAIDDLVFVERYPEPNTKVAVQALQRQGGGLTGTAVVAAARLGARSAYCGVLGFDELSQFALCEFGKEGVDCSLVSRREGARPVHSVVIVIRPSGQRTVLCSHDSVVAATSEDITEGLIRRCRVLLVDNSVGEGGRKAAALARGLGVPVVADFEPDAGPAAPDLMDLVDHLIVGMEFARLSTGECDPAHMVQALASPSRVACVVTAGELGCWYSERGGGTHHVPAFSVPVVDTTGCGDVFHGAYAAGVARGESVPHALRFASAAAALKATRPGGRAGIPDREAVAQLLARDV
jgi:sulfofructose kinase